MSDLLKCLREGLSGTFCTSGVLHHSSLTTLDETLRKAWSSAQAEEWRELLENCSQCPDIWPDGVQFRPDMLPAIHLLDPLLCIALMLQDPSLVGSDGERLDWACQPLTVAISGEGNTAPLYTNTWAINGETTAVPPGEPMAVHAIRGTNTSEFLTTAAQTAIQDGMDGIVAVALSYDKTTVSAKRNAYPLLLKIVNWVDKTGQKPAAFELIGMLSTYVHEDCVANMTQTQLKAVRSARVIQTINTVLRRFEHFNNDGCVFFVGPYPLRLRPVVTFVTVDVPDAHVFCGTVASWHHACLAHAESAANTGLAASASAFCEGACTPRSAHHYQAAYAREDDIYGVDHSRRVVSLTPAVLGVHSSLSTLYHNVGARVGADPMHQLLHGLVKGLFENIVLTAIFYSSSSSSTANSQSENDVDDESDFDAFVNLAWCFEGMDNVDESAGSAALPSSATGKRLPENCDDENHHKRRRTMTVEMQEALESQARLDEFEEFYQYSAHRSAPLSAAACLRTFDSRAAVAFSKGQHGGLRSFRALSKSLSTCSGLQARDYAIIVSGLCSIVGFNGEVIQNAEAERLVQLVIAQALHILALAYHPPLGAHTTRHLAALAAHVDALITTWREAFPAAVYISSSKVKRAKCYPVDTSKMHSLRHLVFHIVTKGRVQEQDTAPAEHYHTYVKKYFQHTQRRFDTDCAMSQILTVGTTRMIARRVLQVRKPRVEHHNLL